MQSTSIQQVSPNSTALNAENYQTFEMAKANDDVLGGDDIAQIRSYWSPSRGVEGLKEYYDKLEKSHKCNRK